MFDINTLRWAQPVHSPAHMIRLLAALAFLSAVPSTSSGQPRELKAIVHAAINQARAGIHQADAWRRRLRWSALMPRVSARVSRSDGWGEFLDLSGDRAAALDTNTHERWRWEVRLSWDFARLIFDQRELQVARTTRQLVRSRQKLIEQIVRLYYQREKLRRLLREEAGNNTPEAKQRAQELAEINALLQMLHHH